MQDLIIENARMPSFLLVSLERETIKPEDVCEVLEMEIVDPYFPDPAYACELCTVPDEGLPRYFHFQLPQISYWVRKEVEFQLKMPLTYPSANGKSV